MSFPEPVCPAARPVAGATPEQGGVVCSVMERDQARADRILEGAPVGVMITWADDPSTLAHFCCGTSAPAASPDAPPRSHYSSCPIWAAGKEIDLVERAFALQAPEGDPVELEVMEPTAEETEAFLGTRG